MPPARVLVPLTLVVGEEDLLVGRAVSAVVQAARALDPQVDVRDLQGAEVLAGDLPELLSPSLFGDRRVLVVRAAQDLTPDVAAELTAYADRPARRGQRRGLPRGRRRRASRCSRPSRRPVRAASRRRR